MPRGDVAPGDGGNAPGPAEGDLAPWLAGVSRRLDHRSRREIPLGELRPAAVVLALCQTPQGLCVLFTVRTSLVETHKGEISFPGGRVDPGDVDTLAAALRETEEEVGLGAEDLRCVGCLDDFVSISGYRVTPYVMHLARRDFTFRPAPQEVDEILLVPLTHLLDPAHHRADVRRESTWLVHYFHWGPYVIWGLTAAILKRFLDIAFDDGDVP